ncbi:MAG: glycosyltransferase family 2 protein [Rhodospirillales bacterium]|nr:glycosyltransferase family 2 protein [Rhodospirillales bacterium]
MTTVSVLIPAYNEESTILELLTKVNKVRITGVKFEILVIDDGSTDKTVALLESKPKLYTQLIKMPYNGGKGAAVKAGLRSATGDYILFQDADLEYDPADYPRLLIPVLKHQADVVMGSRFSAPDCLRVFYFWHKVGNYLITLIFNILNNTTFTDIYSCYLMFRRDLVDPDQLRTLGWDQHAEILSIATRRGRVIYEVPINYHGRTYEEGKKIRAYHVIAVVWTMFRMRIFG